MIFYPIIIIQSSKWSKALLFLERISKKRDQRVSLDFNLTYTLVDLLQAGEDQEVLHKYKSGIDNRMRRRFRGNRPMPKIGYGNDKKTRYHLANGLKKFVVHSVKDLDVLLMNNRTYCAEIAHNVSSRSRTEIVKRAQQIRVKITNARGKVRT